MPRVDVIEPDYKICDVCDLDASRVGMKLMLGGEQIFICIVCLDQMVEDCAK